MRRALVVAAVVLGAGPAYAQTAPDDFREVTQAPKPETPPDRPWLFSVFGYLRAGYDHTMKDSRYDFIGRNNGFVLDSARVGIDGRNTRFDLAWRISAEGAADIPVGPNTPAGTLSIRLRDAFGRWDPVPWLGVQAGQFKAPFQEEELRGTNDLLFASRAVGIEGVPVGRGFETPGIALDRQLGVMLSPAKPIGGDLGANYYLMVMNGNGANQLLDDNGKLGLVARTELQYLRYARVGAAVFRNDRTVGTLPNLYDEEDLGLTGDVSVRVSGLDAFGSITRLRTTFPTVGTSARVQLAFHAQVGWRFMFEHFYVTPAYRYAYFHPWQSGGDEGFDTFRIQHHTFGIRSGNLRIPIQAWLNYTLTVEEAGRRLGNDRIELLGQVTF